MNTELMNAVSSIVAAHLSRQPMPAEEVPVFVERVAAALARGASSSLPAIENTVSAPVPAVPVELSVADDHIICLEDGAKLKMLKRHLRSHYGMTVEQYKERWGLPDDYPVVAPAYGRRRSELAKRTGFQPLAAA